MIRPNRVAAWLVPLVWGPWLPAAADIYAYTGVDGSVFLSNVPADERYRLLIGGAGQSPELPAPATPASSKATAPRHQYREVIDDVSRTYGIESALLHAVVAVESRYDARAVSGKGALGLMQLMPQTARRYGVIDAFDPRQNLEGGARYLRDLLRLFDNDLRLALAAYNAGEHAVMKHGNRIPPYGETLRYVPLVMDFYARYRGQS